MPNHDIICFGASAGGLEALRGIIGGWEKAISASLFVVIHSPSDAPSALPSILTRTDTIPAMHAEDGDKIEHGRIYTAPPDYHMIIEDSKIRLSKHAKENLVRPAVDPLFRTAARTYGPRTVGVVLSGNLDDGTTGLMAIKRYGGVTIAQDPYEAAYQGMPRSAIDNGAVDFILSTAEISSKLWELANTPVEERSTGVVEELDEQIIGKDIDAQVDGKRRNRPSTLACPDCGGVLWEIRDGETVRYRCHVGHVMSPQSLAQGMSDRTEESLWSAVRALQEKAMLHRRLASLTSSRRNPERVAEAEKMAEAAEEHANGVLELLRQIPQEAEQKEFDIGEEVK